MTGKNILSNEEQEYGYFNDYVNSDVRLIAGGPLGTLAVGVLFLSFQKVKGKKGEKQ